MAAGRRIVHMAAFFSVCLCSASSTSEVYDFEMPAYRICKPGPKVEKTAKTGKRCLVIGDSISIGYTPWLRSRLADDCDVHHAPWDTRDGGALDSKYGLQCVPLFLKSAMLEPVDYDVIIFNFGMHDVGYSSRFPEEYVPSHDYSVNLRVLKQMLLRTGAEVGFVLTTPAPWDVAINDRVRLYNTLAGGVMKEEPAVPVADLYRRVVLECGEPPYEKCDIAQKQPSPHYTKFGYQYLAVFLSQFITDLLDKSQRTAKKQQEGIELPLPGKTRKLNEIPSLADVSRDCKNKAGEVVSACPFNATCVGEHFSGSRFGCCLLPIAVPCGDGKHCCPAGYRCDPECNVGACKCSYGTT